MLSTAHNHRRTIGPALKVVVPRQGGDLLHSANVTD
jgi:hypothetical protein